MATASSTAAIAVVRVRADHDGWAEALPVVPVPLVVTVTVTPPTPVPLATLEERGYRFVGRHHSPRAGDARVADLLVDEELVTSAPEVWSALRQVAERTFQLAHGPVALAFSDLIAVHRLARRRPPGA